MLYPLLSVHRRIYVVASSTLIQPRTQLDYRSYNQISSYFQMKVLWSRKNDQFDRIVCLLILLLCLSVSCHHFCLSNIWRLHVGLATINRCLLIRVVVDQIQIIISDIHNKPKNAWNSGRWAFCMPFVFHFHHRHWELRQKLMWHHSFDWVLFVDSTWM
jgi:hypothetical protein